MSTTVDVSIVCASVRPYLWGEFLDSLKETKCSFEVIFIGSPKPEGFELPSNVTVIESERPFAPCMAIGFSKAKGAVVHWTADDAIYQSGSVDAIADFFKDGKNRSNAIAVRDICIDRNTTLEMTFTHTLFPNYGISSKVLMAFGAMTKDYFYKLGGVERRFEGTEWENDMSLRVYEDGGHIVVLGDVCLITRHEQIHPIGGPQSPVKHTLPQGIELMTKLWLKDSALTNRTSPVETYQPGDLHT